MCDICEVHARYTGGVGAAQGAVQGAVQGAAARGAGGGGAPPRGGERGLRLAAVAQLRNRRYGVGLEQGWLPFTLTVTRTRTQP